VKGPALRRLLHAGSAAVLLIPLLADWGQLRSVLVAVAVVAVIGDVARIKLPKLSRRLATWVPVFRSGETGRLCGATWLSLGYALAAWFPPIAPAAGILVSALADPAASLVGGWTSPSVGKTVSGWPHSVCRGRQLSLVRLWEHCWNGGPAYAATTWWSHQEWPALSGC